MELVNLKELIKYHPYHISTFAGFANVTQELLEAALRGEEELTRDEVIQIARYVGVAPNVLNCPSLILLNGERIRHIQMLNKLIENVQLISEAAKEGSEAANNYMRWNAKGFINMISDFKNGKQVSYCRYLGAKEKIEDTLLFMKNEQRKPRGRTRGVTNADA